MARPRIHKSRHAKRATVNITFMAPGQKAAWADLLRISNETPEKNLTGFCRSILMSWAALYKSNEKNALTWVKPEQVDMLTDTVKPKKARRKTIESPT